MSGLAEPCRFALAPQLPVPPTGAATRFLVELAGREDELNGHNHHENGSLDHAFGAF
jgi:hypothetical protein